MSKSEELLKQQVDLHIAGNKSLESIISLLQSKNEGSSSDTPLPVKDEKSEMKATSDKVKRHESITMGPIKTGR